MSKKLWYTWESMRRDVNVLCREIVLDKFDPQVIVGLSRGGLVPGVMLSHWFQKPFKPIKASMRDFADEDDAWEDYYPRKSDEKILIVDDICDSGKTFSRIFNKIKQRKEATKQGGASVVYEDGLPVTELRDDIDVRFASLWWNNECNFEPHYYAQDIAKDSTNTWIHFCWESPYNLDVV